MMKKQNNNKQYGLQKERDVVHFMQKDPDCFFAKRARGSFTEFDIEAFFKNHVKLISVKSTRQKYWSPNAELETLRKIKIPWYCVKYLYIYWSPRKDREKQGWEKLIVE